MEKEDNMLTDIALKAYKDYTKWELSYARYKVGSSYIDIPIDRVEMIGDKALKVYLVINNHRHSTITVSEIQLINTDNEVFCQFEENIVINANEEGYLYVVKFKFKEGSDA